MWLATFIAVALAAPPLRVDVVTDPPKIRATPRPLARAGAVSLGHTDALSVDGLREPAWHDIPDAPALLVRPDGTTPEVGPLQVATTPEHLVFGLPALPAGHATTLMVDPDGARRAWWVVTLSHDALEAERCTLRGLALGDATFVPSRAVPCRPADGPVVGRSDAWWELAIPWRSMPAATSRMRLLWRVDGPDRIGGTWAHGGRPGTLPERAIPVDMPQPRGQLEVHVDSLTSVWTVHLREPAPHTTWRWQRTNFGEVVDQGTVTTPEGDLSWTLPPLATYGAALTLRLDTTRKIAAGFSIRVGRPEGRARLLSPVFDDALIIAWQTSAPVPHHPLRVRDEAGRLLGEAAVDLPQGTGTLRITTDASWPAVVLVDLPGLLEGGPRAERLASATRLPRRARRVSASVP